MDPISLALLGLGAGGLGVGASLWRRRKARRAWARLGEHLGLSPEEAPLRHGPCLQGLRRGVPLRVRVLGRGRMEVAALFSLYLPPGLVLRPKGQRWPAVDPASDGPFLVGLALSAPGQHGLRAMSFASHSVVRATVERLLAAGAPFALTSEALVGLLLLSLRDEEGAARLVDSWIDEVLRIEAGLTFQMPGAEPRSTAPSLMLEDLLQESEPTEPKALGGDERSAGSPETGQEGETPEQGASSTGAIDRLVEDLAKEGTRDSEGEFTLDRATAREKMRQFQLEDPFGFALLLVGAALLRGAKKVTVETGRHFRMTFDGTPLSRAEADRIWSSIFTTKGAKEERALRFLGLALHGALGPVTDEVRIRSGSSGEGIDWRLFAEGTGAEECLPLEGESPDGGTEVVFPKPRWPRGGLVDLRLFLMERLAHADAEVLLDGAPVASCGLRPEGAKGVVSLPGGLGAIGFAPGRGHQGELRVVVQGLLVETLSPKALLPHLVAVVTHPLLETDLSLRRVVRNQAFKEVCDLVLAHQAEALRAFLQDAFPASARSDVKPDPRAEAVARACLGHDLGDRLLTAKASGGASEATFVSREEVDLLPPDHWNRLTELPLYSTLDGGRVSLETIQGWSEEMPMLSYASFSCARACLEPEVVREAVGDPSRILLLAWPMRSQEGRPLARLFEGRIRDVSEALWRLPRSEAMLKERLFRV